MALRLIDAFLNPQSTTGLTQARVYRDAEWNEYRVRFYGPNGVYKGEECDGHTDDKADAIGTAKLSIGLTPARDDAPAAGFGMVGLIDIGD